jgi:hypothetical protein
MDALMYRRERAESVILGNYFVNRETSGLRQEQLAGWTGLESLYGAEFT